MRKDPSPLVALLDVDLDPELLRVALTHRSWSYENGSAPHNERLEFLGDSVLGIIITDELYRRDAQCSEGQLAKMRSAVVNAGALADVARSLDLGEYLHLGRGEDATGGRDKSSILADTMEAVIGATYLSIGLPVTTEMVLRLFAPLLQRAAELGAGLDWKTSLQEAAAADGLGMPEYRVTDVGPDHAKEFSASVFLSGDVVGEGVGRSKKAAEQEAAAQAYRHLRE